MDRILQSDAAASLPLKELTDELEMFLESLSAKLPERRLRQVGSLAVRGIIGAESPVVTEIAGALMRDGKTIRPMARRLYRFVWNRWFDHRDLLKGLYGIAQRAVANHDPAQLVVALDRSISKSPKPRSWKGSRR